MRLSYEIIESVRAEVDTRFGDASRDYGKNHACQQALQQIAESNDSDRDRQLLRRFFAIVWLFDQTDERGVLNPRLTDDLSHMAESALKTLGIKPHDAPLGYLYRSLYRGKAKQLLIDEQPWLATWNAILASAMDADPELAGTSHSDFSESLVLAASCHRAGLVAESAQAYRLAEARAKQTDQLIMARFGLIRTLRLQNQVEAATRLAEQLKQDVTLRTEQQRHLDWECAFLAAQRDHGVGPLVERAKALREILTVHDANDLILAVLWCYAFRHRSAMTEMPGSNWFKVRCPQALVDQKLRDQLRLIETLEASYDPRETIWNKLKALSTVLNDLRLRPASLEIGVFLAAVVRFLSRVDQPEFARLVMHDYEMAAWNLSGGAARDLFGLLKDLASKQDLRPAADARPTSATPWRPRLRHWLATSVLWMTLTRELGLAKIFAWIKLLPPDELRHRLWCRLSLTLAEPKLRDSTSVFRMLALAVGNAPIPAQTLADQAPAAQRRLIAATIMRRIFEETSSKSIDDLFAEFNVDPIRVEPTTQIYRARLYRGEEVAIKICRPDAADRLTVMRHQLSRTTRWWQWSLPQRDLELLGMRLEQLLQYQGDLSYQAMVHQTLYFVDAKCPHGKIPRIHNELSNAQVLTTEYIHGADFLEFMEKSASTDRQRAASVLGEFYLRMLLQTGFICLDPQTEHWLFRNQDVFILEFDGLMRVSDTAVTIFQQLLAIERQDAPNRYDLHYELYRAHGLIEPTPGVDPEDVKHWLQLQFDLIHWDRCTNPKLAIEYQRIFREKQLERVLRVGDSDFFLVWRAMSNLARTLSRFEVAQPLGWLKEMAQVLVDGRLQ